MPIVNVILNFKRQNNKTSIRCMITLIQYCLNNAFNDRRIKKHKVAKYLAASPTSNKFEGFSMFFACCCLVLPFVYLKTILTLKIRNIILSYVLFNRLATHPSYYNIIII